MDLTQFIAKSGEAVSRLSTDKKPIIDAKSQVYEQYQEIFSYDGIDRLSKEQFAGFLQFESNRHWTGLNRNPEVYANITELRNALKILLDERPSLELRFTESTNRVKGLGKGIATAVLHVAHPDKYRVWNGTSEKAMKEYGIFPSFQRGESTGSQYAKVNQRLLEVSTALNLDLWAVDAVWWSKAVIPATGTLEESGLTSGSHIESKKRTLLYVWKPSKWAWDIVEAKRKIDEDGYVKYNWRTNRKNLRIGDRVFIMRVGEALKGIVASGFIGGKPHSATEEDTVEKGSGTVIPVHLDAVQDVLSDEAYLPVERLMQLGKMNWFPQSEGNEIPSAIALQIERLWQEIVVSRIYSPQSEAIVVSAIEGGRRSVTVSRSERDPKNREACIAHHGAVCAVCGFDFEREFGSVAKGFIHVHHHNPLADTGASPVNPITEMSPLCPNCHAVAHLESPPISIEGMKELRRDRSASSHSDRRS